MSKSKKFEIDLQVDYTYLYIIPFETNEEIESFLEEIEEDVHDEIQTYLLEYGSEEVGIRTDSTIRVNDILDEEAPPQWLLFSEVEKLPKNQLIIERNQIFPEPLPKGILIGQEYGSFRHELGIIEDAEFDPKKIKAFADDFYYYSESTSNKKWSGFLRKLQYDDQEFDLEIEEFGTGEIRGEIGGHFYFFSDDQKEKELNFMEDEDFIENLKQLIS
jgi:hypothetical protein